MMVIQVTRLIWLVAMTTQISVLGIDLEVFDMSTRPRNQVFYAGRPETVTFTVSIASKERMRTQGEPLFKATIFFSSGNSCAVGEVKTPYIPWSSRDLNFVLPFLEVTNEITLPEHDCAGVSSLCIHVGPADCADWQDSDERNNVRCTNEFTKRCPEDRLNPLQIEQYEPASVSPTPVPSLINGCPLGWVAASTEEGEKCYGLIPIRQKFEDAATFCNNLGGNLISIGDVTESMTVEKIIRSSNVTFKYNSPLWIGLVKWPGFNWWVWVDDSASSFRRWHSTRAEFLSSGATGLCAAVQTSSSCGVEKLYRWTAVPCTKYDCHGGLYFLCEKSTVGYTPGIQEEAGTGTTWEYTDITDLTDTLPSESTTTESATTRTVGTTERSTQKGVTAGVTSGTTSGNASCIDGVEWFGCWKKEMAVVLFMVLIASIIGISLTITKLQCSKAFEEDTYASIK